MTSLTPPVIDAPALLRSALTRTVSVSDLTAWLSVAAAATRNRITMRTLDQLDSWSISPLTGDITHRTGRFFSITGVRVEGEDSLDQPIIDQPDVGVLGLLGQVRDGVLHMLIQAKVEPGNRRLAQISHRPSDIKQLRARTRRECDAVPQHIPAQKRLLGAA
jgi:oxidase EvaA